jgi:hypothetical protein
MKVRSPLAASATLLAALLTTPATPADPARNWFRSELDAVVSAAQHYNPLSIREDREFMGAILRRDDHYTFTVGAGAPGADRVSVRIVVPEGYELVAFWHTHGAAHHVHRYFSHIDTALVRKWQKRFYLADYTGTLKVMAPGAATLSQHRARRLGLPPRSGYARGDVVADDDGAPIRIATRSRPTG